MSGADLRKAYLSKADLREADLSKANLSGANLHEANLSRADLSRADLRFTNLTGADLSEAFLFRADLSGANLSETNLSEAILIYSHLVGTNIEGAKISKSHVYAVNVWNLKGEFQEQNDLVITPLSEPSITVDDIQVAQFIYLILNNKEIRRVIDTLTSKTVLILGRFTPKRKVILDALRERLRKLGLVPIVFDFNRPTDKDFTETVKTLAGMSYFVIVDLSSPRSAPLELQAIVPDSKIPFVPIIQEKQKPFAMFADLQMYDWVMDTIAYDSLDGLLEILEPHIIEPAMKKREELRLRKAARRKPVSARKLRNKDKSQ